MRSGNVCASYPYQVGGFLPLLPENDVARRKIIKNLLLQIECFKLKNYLNILVGTTISIEPITTETIKLKVAALYFRNEVGYIFNLDYFGDDGISNEIELLDAQNLIQNVTRPGTGTRTDLKGTKMSMLHVFAFVLY